MARTKIDLQRYKKVYPQMKSGPHFFSQSNEVETHKLSFSGESIKTFGVGIYNYPVIVLTPEDNINAWVSAVVRPVVGGAWQITVETSTSYTGKIHVHVAEGNP
jgi:hypothetical protein